MHRRKAAWRNVLSALVLVTIALPLATTPLAQTASAQSTPNPDAIAGVGQATPGPVAFNPIGVNHTVTFTCTNTVTEGCFALTASVQNSTTGDAATFAAATCQGDPFTEITTATVQCEDLSSATCPATISGIAATPHISADATACVVTITTDLEETACTAANGEPTIDPTATTPGLCTLSSTSRFDQMAVTINSGAPDVYTITFSGYIPATRTTNGFACPAGTTGPMNVSFESFMACQFFVSVQKKYVEVTKVTLTPSSCGSSAIQFSEGLKSFFGQGCTLQAIALGMTEIKTGVSCTTLADGTTVETGMTSSKAPAEFGTGAIYNCVNGVLSVINIPSTLFASGGLPFQYTATGPGSFTNGSGVTLNGLCAGASNVSTSSTTTTTSTGAVVLCPTGVGNGTVQACFLGTSTVNTQPTVCSASIPFAFTSSAAARVIPYVRWAGEKIVLTKCFGGAGLGASATSPGNGLYAGSLVQFSLQASDNTQAILLPAVQDVAGQTSIGTTGPTGGAASLAPSGSETVYTVADQNGCASVIAYARNEGVVNVDAAIYSTAISASAGGVQLLNEHAFAVYYLKFDHLDLENITTSTYNTATALQKALSFSAATPAGKAPPGFVTSFPGALAATFTLPNPPGTGNVAPGTYAIPICKIDYVRAMVHGYFEMPGDPSGRPASNIAISGASTVNGTGTAAAGSYVLPAGRWVLPEDWPVLATFAGFNSGSPLNITPSSLYAWDINSGWAFNPNGENAVVCFQQVPGAASGTYSSSIPAANMAPGPITTFNEGPCYSTDTAGNTGAAYSTAPAPLACTTGITVGPFDMTQACRNDVNGAYAGTNTAMLQPPGSSILTASGNSSFSLGPLSTNSSFLPNGTLNEWDAPMPPAQITFGVTSGPGFLDQVNKTGLYSLALGATTSSTLICSPSTAPTGFTLSTSGSTCVYTYTQATTLAQCISLFGSGAVSSGATCQISGTFTSNPGTAIYPNPFYSEAIPASPLIPPIINNGGYLWDTFGFRGGVVAGFTLGTATVAGLAADTGTGLLAGVTESSFGATGCSSSTTVDVNNGSQFTVGQVVTIYSFTGTGLAGIGSVVGHNLTVTAVNGNTLTLSAPVGADLPQTCTAAGTAIVVSNDVGITLPSSSVGTLTPGTTVVVQQPNGVSATTTVQAVAGATVYLTNATGLASALNGCNLLTNTACLGLLLNAGTLVVQAPTIASVPVRDATPYAGGAGPYPFWQWVGGAGPTHPTSGTVYSDNHGEAVVSYETGLTSGTLQVVPVAGTCPVGYSFVPATSTTAANCLLNLAQLGLSTGAPFGTFQNVAAVTGGVASPAATATGCFNTTTTGAPTAATGATASVGANGPAAGQICVNGLGGVEFGAGAVLGSATIQAVADYPYTRGDHPQISSATLTKTFASGFVKSLTVTAGPAAPAGTGISNYVVTITALDICGNPLVGEPVQVFALGNAGAVVLAPMGGGTSLGTGTANVVIGANGTATLSLEVLQSAIGNQGLVIKAVFPLEAIERIFVVQSGTAGQQTTVLYGPGYNMVGGPPGSNFSMSEALFSYNATTGQYANATASAGNLSSAAPACTGYWSYFAAATAVNLTPSSAVTSPATCTLAPGFNLIGNPFITPASIQSGFTAYHWNGTSYDVTQTIPVGGSVFIFNPSSTSTTVTLTAT